MDFKKIEFGSSDFFHECELRHEVLRVPLGLRLHDEDLSQEAEQLHFGLFDGSVLLASVIAVPLSSSEVKVRQMAVRSLHQRQGLGRKIMHCLEEHLSGRGFRRFSMHARVSAVGFYEKLGYETVSGEFSEVGIPHVKMEKIRIGGGE
ncbi:MAG: GNAT family N-acetyltransferase [Akkermansiaceae bacterium]|nr:GNAT family N-acetyltransferase [Akkermansiaceae bacterium]